jgi:hypothetical protein
MQLQNVLYKDLRIQAFDLLSSGEYPETLIFNGGSAYCSAFYNTVYEKIIPRIDLLALKAEKTKYELSEMVRFKNTLHQMLYASDDKTNWNIDRMKWNEENLGFSNVKLKA